MIKQLRLMFLVFFLIVGSSYGNQLKIDQFVSPETCGDCHTDIYNQWHNSMHHQAHYDPVYLRTAEFLRAQLSDKDEIAEAESCVKCHTPVGNITGYPLKLSDDRGKIPEIAKKGIQCDYCHSATSASKPYNNGLIIKPGNGEDEPGIKRGPYKDSESDYHETAYSKFHTESQICGTCHDVKHIVFNTPLETSYTEWQKSPYNSSDKTKRITCQGCHMYQKPGIPATGSTPRPANKGNAADDGPLRDHVFTHFFVGANVPVPSENGDKNKALMAKERLQNAAELSINTQNIKKGKIAVTIKNTGAGHYLPTGLTDIRQIWLSIVIKDQNGKKIFSKGEPDLKGYIPPGVKIYNTVFGDGKGKPVDNIAKAREILSDNRIPPLKSVTEIFRFNPDKSMKLKLNVELLYRSAPQKLLDKVFDKKKIVLPIIVMENFTMIL